MLTCVDEMVVQPLNALVHVIDQVCCHLIGEILPHHTSQHLLLPARQQKLVC